MDAFAMCLTDLCRALYSDICLGCRTLANWALSMHLKWNLSYEHLSSDAPGPASDGAGDG